MHNVYPYVFKAQHLKAYDVKANLGYIFFFHDFFHMQLFLRVQSETMKEFYRRFPLQKCIILLTLYSIYLKKLWHRKYFKKISGKFLLWGSLLWSERLAYYILLVYCENWECLVVLNSRYERLNQIIASVNSITIYNGICM